jgi:hypothetical protein
MNNTTESLVDNILNNKKNIQITKNTDLSFFTEKYLDMLELKELYYNINKEYTHGSNISSTR